MLGALLLWSFLGLQILRLIERFAQVIRGLTDLLLHAFQVVLVTTLHLAFQRLKLLRHLFICDQGCALLLLPLGAL